MEVRRLPSLHYERECAAAAAGPLHSTAGSGHRGGDTRSHGPLDDLDHTIKGRPTALGKGPLYTHTNTHLFIYL